MSSARRDTSEFPTVLNHTSPKKLVPADSSVSFQLYVPTLYAVSWLCDLLKHPGSGAQCFQLSLCVYKGVQDDRLGCCNTRHLMRANTARVISLYLLYVFAVSWASLSSTLETGGVYKHFSKAHHMLYEIPQQVGCVVYATCVKNLSWERNFLINIIVVQGLQNTHFTAFLKM